VDESATGSVNFFLGRPSARGRIAPMHLRAPSVDQGVHAFGWSVVFFLFMWLGALAIGVQGGIAFIVPLVLAGIIFLFVRKRGGDYPGRR
jgi:hypothetical protein